MAGILKDTRANKNNMKKTKQDIDYNNIEFEYVDTIPVAFCRPNKEKSNNSIAIWLPYLGGDKQTGAKELQKLASCGYFAISIDPWLHGERKGKLKKGIRSLVFNQFRTYMWQIMGITTMDVVRVIDWAIDTFDLNDSVVVGGLSMGGDIAITLAGIDKRIKKVAAIAASPDWDRTGMTDVMDSKKIIEQGNPSNYGQWLYDKLNPMSNLDSFCKPLKLHIELGETDTHINPQWTIAFKKALYENYPEADSNIEIVINEGCNHLSLIQRKSIIDKAIDFMTGGQNE